MPGALSTTLFDAVAASMRAVAAEVIVPRFRALATHEVEEKAPGELVTIADREAEQQLEPVLRRLLPGSRVVGEERCARVPELLHGLERAGEVVRYGLRASRRTLRRALPQQPLSGS
jgi:3'-phosphoadenosine 5'-phosphosulfate (PAPS) 3'-phosphatase